MENGKYLCFDLLNLMNINILEIARFRFGSRSVTPIEIGLVCPDRDFSSAHSEVRWFHCLLIFQHNCECGLLWLARQRSRGVTYSKPKYLIAPSTRPVRFLYSRQQMKMHLYWPWRHSSFDSSRAFCVDTQFFVSFISILRHSKHVQIIVNTSWYELYNSASASSSSAVPAASS